MAKDFPGPPRFGIPEKRGVFLSLDDKRFRILARRAQLFTAQQIGAEMFLSPRTVSAYLTQAAAYLNFGSTEEMLREFYYEYAPGIMGPNPAPPDNDLGGRGRRSPDEGRSSGL